MDEEASSRKQIAPFGDRSERARSFLDNILHRDPAKGDPRDTIQHTEETMTDQV
jgi:hypothetical protein